MSKERPTPEWTTDYVTALADLVTAARIDGPPAPIGVDWSRERGLEVNVAWDDWDAWTKDTLTITGPTVETFVWSESHQVRHATPCVIATLGTPCTLVSYLSITQDQLAVQRASGLSFEEVVAWFAGWPTLQPFQQRTEHREMVEMGVPEGLLPEPPGEHDDSDLHTHASWCPAR